MPTIYSNIPGCCSSLLFFFFLFSQIQKSIKMGYIHSLPEDCLPELVQLLKNQSADGSGTESISPP